MKTLQHSTVRLAIAGAGVVLAGLYLLGPTPAALVVAAAYAAVMAVAVARARV